MLKIVIPDIELFNKEDNRFYTIKGQELQLEHSLVSISKWESKWKKPFIDKTKKINKTEEEVIDYIRCMTLTQNVNSELYNYIPGKEMKRILEYIEDSMTATTFSDINTKPDREIITSEIIYYAMVAYNIPFECQKWHLNRLLTLIKVCSIKNSPGKKMSKRDILSRNNALNMARRQSLKTKG